MDTAKLRLLLDQRDDLDRQIMDAAGATSKDRAPQRCSNCNELGHSARTCKKPKEHNGASTQ